MPDIMIAFSSGMNEYKWQRFLHDLNAGEAEFTVGVEIPVWRWRDGCEQIPITHPGDRVYIVFNRLVRGFAPLVCLSGQKEGQPWFTLMLDLTQWEPCGLEWAWGAEFRRSWRYARFTRPCLTDFPAWDTDPGLTVAPWPQRAARKELVTA